MKPQSSERLRHRQKYVSGILVVKLRQDVLANLPSAFAALPRGSVRLPSTLEKPFLHLQQAGLIVRVVPVFVETTIRLKPGERPVRRDRTIAGAFAASVHHPQSQELRGINVLQLSPKADLSAIEKDLKAIAAIEYVHRAAARWPSSHHETAGMIAALPSQWNLDAIKWNSKKTDASTVKVGVLDTGLDCTHPNLPRPSSYHHVGSSAVDIVGHGTQVVGVMCARPNKKIQIQGICNCDLHVWKIFGDSADSHDGQYYVDVVMYQRALNAARIAGVQVVNLSIGGTGQDPTEKILVNRLVTSGITVVAAMGNDFLNGNPVTYPAVLKGVVAVGATDSAGRHAQFSSSGRHTALCAPGVKVVSTLPMKRSASRGAKQTRFGICNGTSLAAPQVAAAAALLIAADPARTSTDVVNRLKSTATRLPGMGRHKKTFKYGTGLLNIRAALK